MATGPSSREFVHTNFAGDQESLDVMFSRFEKLFEVLNGHLLEIILAFREQSDLDIGPIMPFDRVLAAYNPGAHIDDDFFANKLAFTVLLNFPLTNLEQRLTEGENWSRRQWAEARLGNSFSTRIPAEVQQEVSTAGAIADEYIAEYNIWMHHLLNDEGERLFPAKMKLLTHWNLRDQIKADYTDPEGLPKQRLTQKVMERIVDQTIPEMVVNNPLVDWNPYSNEVWPAAVQDSDHVGARWTSRSRTRRSRTPDTKSCWAPFRRCAWWMSTRRQRRPSSSGASTRTGRSRKRGSRRCSNRCSLRRCWPRSAS